MDIDRKLCTICFYSKDNAFKFIKFLKTLEVANHYLNRVIIPIMSNNTNMHYRRRGFYDYQISKI